MSDEAAEAVADAPRSAETSIAEYMPTEAALADLRKRHQDVVFDLRTTAGDKAARLARMELVKLRTSLEAKRKELKAPALEYAQRIDREAKRLTAEILALEAPIDEQIRADEQRREDERRAKIEAEQKRVAGLQARIAQIRAVATRAVGQVSAEIVRKIATVEAVPIGEDFAEFQAEASTAKAETIETLRELHAKAQASEAEAARLAAERAEIERQRAEQAERDRVEQERLAAERAALEAQQRAAREQQQREEAEARERRRREDEAAAAARAEQDRIAAEARAREQAELDRQREQLRQQQEEQERQARAAREAAEAAERERQAAREAQERAEREERERAEAAAREAATRVQNAAPRLLEAVRALVRVMRATQAGATLTVETTEEALRIAAGALYEATGSEEP